MSDEREIVEIEIPEHWRDLGVRVTDAVVKVVDYSLSDAEITLTMFRGEEPIAVSSATRDLLRGYYGVESFDSHRKAAALRGRFGGDPSVFDKYDAAVAASKGLTGIVLMQGLTDYPELKKDIPYKDLLMRAWKGYSRIMGFEIEFFLPGYMNAWLLHSFEAIAVPSSVFDSNYDAVARRHGFVLDEEKHLYLRKEQA